MRGVPSGIQPRHAMWRIVMRVVCPVQPDVVVVFSSVSVEFSVVVVSFEIVVVEVTVTVVAVVELVFDVALLDWVVEETVVVAFSVCSSVNVFIALVVVVVVVVGSGVVAKASA